MFSLWWLRGVTFSGNALFLAFLNRHPAIYLLCTLKAGLNAGYYHAGLQGGEPHCPKVSKVQRKFWRSTLQELSSSLEVAMRLSYLHPPPHPGESVAKIQPSLWPWLLETFCNCCIKNGYTNILYIVWYTMTMTYYDTNYNNYTLSWNATPRSSRPNRPTARGSAYSSERHNDQRKSTRTVLHKYNTVVVFAW